MRGELAHSYGLENIIAASQKMTAVLEIVGQIADSAASVLLTGESGTGKELIARALHFRSRRQQAPFVPVNCAAIPDNLLESELFGHVKGAFTDARQSKTGLFQSARGGTLFLDEIGEMPLLLQAKLLRVIEDKRVRPVGATEETPVDVRIVSATNSDLEAAMAAAGKFRVRPLLPLSHGHPGATAAARTRRGYRTAGQAFPRPCQRRSRPAHSRDSPRGNYELDALPMAGEYPRAAKRDFTRRDPVPQ